MQTVSVIIPTFRRAHALKRAVDSVLAQSYVNVEVIVVDDNDPASTFRAQTEEVMRAYNSDGRVLYIQHSSNLNASTARNSGFNRSTGDFICFLDDDDWYVPETVERQVNFLRQNKQFGAVYCGAIIKGRSAISTLQGDLTKELLQMKTSLFTPSIMFRREAVLELKGFDPRFTRHQDYEFMMRFFRSHQIGVIREALVHIETNDGENRLDASKLDDCKYLFFYTFNNDLNKFSPTFRRRVYAIHYMHVFIAYLREGKLKDALRVFTKYFFGSPLHFAGAMVDKSADYFRYYKSRQTAKAC